MDKATVALFHDMYVSIEGIMHAQDIGKLTESEAVEKICCMLDDARKLVPRAYRISTKAA